MTETTTTPRPTCQNLTPCTGDQEVGITASYGDWRLCEAHAMETLDRLNPNRKPGGATTFWI